MKSNVERVDAHTVTLTVTCSAEEVEKALDRAYKDVAKKVRIPGFRKGHVPRPVIDNYVGPEVVLAEATEDIVQDTYPQVIDELDLRPIESPDMGELDTIVPGEEYVWSAEVQVRPELTLSKYDDIAVTVPSAEATDADVDAQIEILRERFAQLEPVEDRGVEADDFVLLSFVGTVDGEPYEGNSVDKYLYELGQGQMPAEFDAALIGVKAGSEARAEFEIPDTSSVEEFVGKTAAFDIQVHEIKAKALPEVDDEFAANVGGFDSVDDLRANLKDRLSHEKGIAHERTTEKLAREELTRRLEGEVPDAMVRKRFDAMMRDFSAGLEQRGMNINQYLEATGLTPDQVEVDIKNDAEQSIKEDLALEALFRARGFELKDSDLDEEIALLAEASKVTPEEARERWTEMGLIPLLREQSMQRMAMRWLLENIEIDIEGDTASGTKKTKATKNSGKKKAEKASQDEPQAEPESAETSEE